MTTLAEKQEESNEVITLLSLKEKIHDKLCLIEEGLRFVGRVQRHELQFEEDERICRVVNDNAHKELLDIFEMLEACNG